MSTKKDVAMKGIVTNQQAVTYLQDIVSSFKSGIICVQHGEEFVTLKPEDMVFLEIEAEQKKDKERIIIELSWKKGDVLNEGIDLKISAKEPESVTV